MLLTDLIYTSVVSVLVEKLEINIDPPRSSFTELYRGCLIFGSFNGLLSDVVLGRVFFFFIRPKNPIEITP